MTMQLFAIIINIPADHTTIQAGIYAAAASDTILVAPGTYFENINYVGKNITISSHFLTTQDTAYISQTIIDGNQNGRVVTFENDEDSTAVLCGFTITNGIGGILCYDATPSLIWLRITYNIAEDGGGGIYIVSDYSFMPNISHLRVSHNSSLQYGGGIYLGGVGSTYCISHCVIQFNTSANGGGISLNRNYTILLDTIIKSNIGENGGGIHIDNSNPTITSCFIGNNTAIKGGGIHSSSYSQYSITNTIIINNQADMKGGGVSCDQWSDPTIINSTIINNSANHGGGVFCRDSSDPIIINSIIWDNEDEEIFLDSQWCTALIAYSNIKGGEEAIITNGGYVQWLNGNITSNPLFTSPLVADYHLQDYSPCIGAGIDALEINGEWVYAPNDDLDRNQRPNPTGSMPDMGVYENPLGEPLTGVSSNLISNNTDHKLMNYPNPFNPSTTISFRRETRNVQDAKLKIFNLKGQLIRNFDISSNQSSVVWDGLDQSCKPVSNGIYFAKLEADGKELIVNKMLLLK